MKDVSCFQCDQEEYVSFWGFQMTNEAKSSTYFFVVGRIVFPGDE